MTRLIHALDTHTESLGVLVVPDKFKGTLTAGAAAKAIATGWRRLRPQDTLDLLPMSDGGDGFGEVISSLLGARAESVSTVDAAHRPCVAHWWWQPDTRTAIVESATVIGLAMLPPKQYHPFQLDTFGLGAVLRAAADKGARRCLMGIGGSATNDAGFGLARALGWTFLDAKDRPIATWPELSRLQRICAPRTKRVLRHLHVAVDVQNPLLGQRGATRVYGPQKGLLLTDFAVAERALRRLARVRQQESDLDFARTPGAGAAGGLGFGLLAFLGARLEPGFDLFSRMAKLHQCLRAADIVLTGEGAIDDSTLMGKGVGQVAKRCRELGVPCLGLAGAIQLTRKQTLFTHTLALTDLTSLEEAKAQPARWLEKAAEMVAGRCPLP